MVKRIRFFLKKIFDRNVLLYVIVSAGFLMLAGNTIFSVIVLKKSSSRVVYISMPKLYSGFKMKSDLEARLKKMEADRNKLLEQMQSMVKSPADKTQADSFLTPSDYQVKANKVITNSKKVAEQYTDKVWSTLNQYIKDYCDDHKISIILGANGSGNIMAADPSLDETENILAYANSRYNPSDINN